MDIYNVQTGQQCLRWDPAYLPSGPFWYIRCTQCPYPNPSSGADSIWGKIVPPSQNTTHMLGPYCRAGFNISSVTGGAALQASLKLDDASIANIGRILAQDLGCQDIVEITPRSCLWDSLRTARLHYHLQ
jgi:hypothetical protein